MSAPRVYKTLALVLRGRAYGEADRILTFFTQERGKIDAIAKGVRRTKSSMAGRLEFANEVHLTLHRGRNLDVVVGADIEFAHWLQLVQPERYAAANVMIEVVDAFCEPDLPMPDVYDLLARALRGLRQSADPLTLLPRFSLRLLGALGLGPPLDVCIRCGAPLTSASLDLEQAGFACRTCLPSWQAPIELSADDVANLRALSAAPGAAAEKNATPAAAQAAEALINHHLGRRPKARTHAMHFVPGAAG